MDVPVQELPTTAPSSAPTPLQQISAPPQSFGAGLAAGLKDVGNAFAQRSDVLANHAIAFQTINNKTDSDAANTNYIKAQNNILFGDGTAANPGFYNLSGKNAIDAYPATLAALEKSRNDISDTLPNSAARLMFDADSRRLQQYSEMDASRHAAQQRKEYQNQVVTTSVQALQDQAALHPDDDNRFQAAKQGITNLRENQGAQAGQDLNTVNANILKDVSVMSMQRVQRMADNNPFLAENYYKAHQGDFTPADLLHMDNFFHHTLPPIEAEGAAKVIVGGKYGIPQAVDFASAIEAQEGSGSGVRSSEGAVGRMQLEPATAAAQAQKLGAPLDVALFNGKGDAADAYNRKLGGSYAADMMRRYNGNPALASAAYNAGPAVVDDWINGTNQSGKNASLTRLGDPATGEILTEEWVSKIPFKETRDYVSGTPTRPGILQRLNPSAPVVATSPDPKDHLADYLAQADRMAEYQHPGDAVYAHTLENQVKAQVSTISTEYHAQVTTAQNALQTSLNGGPDGSGPKITTVNQLMSSYDGAKQDWAQLPATVQRGIISQLTQNASGPKGVTIEAQQKYQQYLGMYHNDPESYRNLDIGSDTSMPWSLRKQLIDKQQALQAKPPQNENINHAMSLAAVAGFSQAGITKAADPDTYNKATGLMSQEIDNFVAVHNRKPNDSDIRNISQQILTAGKQQGWFGSSFSAEQAKTTALIGGVPDAEAVKIAESYRKHFGRNPTDGQIQYWYQAGRGK